MAAQKRCEVEKSAFTEHSVALNEDIAAKYPVAVYTGYVTRIVNAAVKDEIIFQDKRYWTIKQFLNNCDLSQIESHTFATTENILNHFGTRSIHQFDASTMASLYIKYLQQYKLLIPYSK